MTRIPFDLFVTSTKKRVVEVKHSGGACIIDSGPEKDEVGVNMQHRGRLNGCCEALACKHTNDRSEVRLTGERDANRGSWL